MSLAIELKHLTFQYNKHKVILKDASLEVAKGALVGLIGDSGVGKTSVLRMINGSLVSEGRQKLSGRISLNGVLMEKEEDFFRQTGTVYQNPDNQIIFSSVEDELAFGMENMCISPELMGDKITQALDLLGIKHLRKRNPNELSGGEKQLIILAAILCLDIDIIILDECMTQIDTAGRKLIIEAIKRMKGSGKTVLMVEHDYENLSIVDQVYRIENQKIVSVDKRSLESYAIH